MRACAAAKSKISTLSAERVWSEMKKLLAAQDPGRALLWMRQIGILTEVLPETEKWGIDAIPGLVAAEQVLGWPAEPLLRLAAIVPPDAARLAKLAERLRLSKAEGAYLQAWANAPAVKDDIADAAFDRLLYRHDPSGVAVRLKLALAVARSKAEDDFEEMARVARLGRLLARVAKWKRPAFPLNGADALAAGVSAGPRVGELLGKLEQEWLDGNFAMNRASLLARLKDLANG